MSGIKSEVEFYSHTPVEDIKAKTKIITAVINFGNNDFAFEIPMKTFDFPNDLMEEHYNENYLETKKYPRATYTGKITSPTKIDVTKNGQYNVTTTGVLDMHGVKQNRTIPATVSIKDGKAVITASFKIKLADHKIAVPTVVATKIAEDIAITIISTLQ